MRRQLGLAAIAALVLAAAAAVPASAERKCRGTIGARTVDNLRVPPRATCVLNRTRIMGTIKVENGATLRATRVRVVGNVQAEGARHVRVVLSRIGGSVEIVQGGSSTLRRNFVNGDVQYF